MIRYTAKGNYNNTKKFLESAIKIDTNILRRYGQMGVEALSNATPIESGLTAKSWGYEILKTRTGFSLQWSNSNIQNGTNIAIILQYGHGTGTGGFVEGRDYINPALKPVFDKMAEELWREVMRA